MPGGLDVLSRLVDGAGPRIDALLLDVWLPDLDGLEVLSRIRAAGLDLPVIMISGHGNVETAVSAVRNGADDFLQKPLSLERVLLTLQKALERTALARERDERRRELASRDGGGAVLRGEGPAMTRLRDEIRRAGASGSRVLITGESGVGKELVARALHDASPRAGKRFVEVNGAAIPEELIESELFGHLKGSFTGATEDRKGKWEQADGGTLFLDEIGDISPKVQVDLLRVLQERKFFRVGGSEEVSVDVRVVAATHRDLEAEVREGRFREDLFYRLNVLAIHLPPLRERREDIPLLARSFLERLSHELGKEVIGVSDGALSLLMDHEWPGNVRELENAVERAIVTCRARVLSEDDFAFLRRPALSNGHSVTIPAGMTLEELEKQAVATTLERTGGTVKEAAAALGIDRSTLYEKIKKYGIPR